MHQRAIAACATGAAAGLWLTTLVLLCVLLLRPQAQRDTFDMIELWLCAVAVGATFLAGLLWWQRRSRLFFEQGYLAGILDAGTERRSGSSVLVSAAKKSAEADR